MTFPGAADFELIVAAENEAGDPDFLEAGAPAIYKMDGPYEFIAAWYWAVEGGHSTKNFGEVPDSIALAELNGSTFGIASIPAHSAGKLEVSSSISDTATVGHGGDPEMHATNTIDYELILSGKVDIELPGGKVRTLGPGSLLVLAGVPHAWKNRYDEDCLYMAITIGATRD